MIQLSVRFLSHVIMWPCCLFQIKPDFLSSLLGSSLLAATAAARTHIKTMQCQCEHAKRVGDTERDWAAPASTGLVLFFGLCSQILSSPKTLETESMWMHGFFLSIASDSVLGCWFTFFEESQPYASQTIHQQVLLPRSVKGPRLLGFFFLFSPWQHHHHWVI